MREQLLTRLGEPKSQIAAGDRVIFYYAREKYVLRNDVVIEVEQVAAEVPRRSAPVETPVAPPPAATAPVAAPGPAPGPAGPVAPPQDLVPARPAPPSTTPGPAPVVQAPVVPLPPDPKVEIKLVRPPSGKDSPASTSAPAPRVETTPVNRPVATAPRPLVDNPVSSAPTPAPVGGPTPSVKADPRTPAPDDARAKAFAAAAEREKKAARRRLDEAAAAEAPPGLFSGKFILLVLVVLGAGAGLLIWRFRQREFELAATSVASTPMPSTPVIAAVPKGDTSIFTAEKLEKLEWKRFEELVAAYYSKTGVVANRTDAGQEAAVHVKISWKGEPRPFAYVQCVVPTFGPIDPKPLHALLAVLAKDDIRRGHVVTTGKFSAAALKLAEEKQLTLLAGDVFLEKLNALPSSARVEIMKVMSGTVG
ncbi:restriction endonuclease [Horticoccus sp. 23ND18S-11]|uniref:restriction endonuclease n=1 Tax=Horticoccus sp. 23ND18S-11 TaxID=3391832 RepID=UPI0039C93BDD